MTGWKIGSTWTTRVAILGTLLAGTPAVAADAKTTAAGHALAEQWCAECHVVEAGQSHAVSGNAPSFFKIADDPSVTEGGLRAFLATPHVTMPNIVLDRQQTDDIIAYILSLRGQ